MKIINRKIFSRRKKSCFSQGFSLLGVLLACFIISISLAGILSLISFSLKAANVNKDRLTASGLAQEGVEVVRNIREKNNSWQDWYGGFATSTVYDYRVQYDSSSFLPYSETPLKVSNGLFSYDAGNNSSFYRKITLQKLPNPASNASELKVTVEVKWQEPGNATWHNLSVEDRLWRWRD